MRGERLPAGREIAGGEMRRLFESCAQDAHRVRGTRPSSLSFTAQARARAEAAALEHDVYDSDTGTLRVLGKATKNDGLTWAPASRPL